MRLADFILQDWRANKGNGKARTVLVLFRTATLLHRLPPQLKFLAYPYVIFYKLLVDWILGIEMPWSLEVGSAARLYHAQALVINSRVRIGAQCVLRNSTTIGVAVTRSDNSGGVPVLGDNVDVGCNVVIIGGITIGDNCVIGAGSVVVKDVPENSVVAGNPARIIKRLSGSVNDARCLGFLKSKYDSRENVITSIGETEAF